MQSKINSYLRYLENEIFSTHQMFLEYDREGPNRCSFSAHIFQGRLDMAIENLINFYECFSDEEWKSLYENNIVIKDMLLDTYEDIDDFYVLKTFLGFMSYTSDLTEIKTIVCVENVDNIPQNSKVFGNIMFCYDENIDEILMMKLKDEANLFIDMGKVLSALNKTRE